MLPAQIPPDATTPAPQRAKPGRKPRVSQAIKAACDLIAAGKHKRFEDVATAVGISREHLSRSLGKDHVQAFISQRARRTIALGVLRASDRVVELVDAQSEHVSLDASKHVLAIDGIKPQENGTNVSITNHIQAGYIINLGSSAPAATPPPMVIDVQKAGDDDASR